MKISHIDTFIVGDTGRNYVFVKVVTEEGLAGIGEAYSCGPDAATVAAIHDFEEWLVGEDPRNIEFLWQKMYTRISQMASQIWNTDVGSILGVAGFSRFPRGDVRNTPWVRAFRMPYVSVSTPP